EEILPPVDLLELDAEPVEVEHVPDHVPERFVREGGGHEGPDAAVLEDPAPAHRELVRHERAARSGLPGHEDGDAGLAGLPHVVALLEAHEPDSPRLRAPALDSPVMAAQVPIKVVQLLAL